MALIAFCSLHIMATDQWMWNSRDERENGGDWVHKTPIHSSWVLHLNWIHKRSLHTKKPLKSLALWVHFVFFASHKANGGHSLYFVTPKMLGSYHMAWTPLPAKSMCMGVILIVFSSSPMDFNMAGFLTCKVALLCYEAAKMHSVACGDSLTQDQKVCSNPM